MNDQTIRFTHLAMDITVTVCTLPFNSILSRLMSQQTRDADNDPMWVQPIEPSRCFKNHAACLKNDLVP